MFALTIKQPWAWLIINGHKDIENRNWPTRYRGRLFIHAGKAFDRHGYDLVRYKFPNIKLPLPVQYEYGGIIGHTDLYGCVMSDQSPWFNGKFGWKLRNAVAVPFFPWRGKQGLFPPPLFMIGNAA